MRTTIDIPEHLLRDAKAQATLQGLRLKDIVRDALQRHLEDAGDLREPARASTLDVRKFEGLGHDILGHILTNTPA